jgi:hypothetical protein
MATNQTLLKQFAVEYANTKEKQTQSEWAKRYKVSKRTIDRWINSPEVKEVLAEIEQGIVAVVRDKAKAYAKQELEELHALAQMSIEITELDKDGNQVTLIDKTVLEAKRKACVDMLGIACIKNVNAEGTGTTVNKYEHNSYNHYSNGQLQEKYAKYLEEHRTEKADPPVPAKK